MKKYYHVDMSGKLRIGQEIELSNDKLSEFGNTYFKKFNALGITKVSSNLPKALDLLDSASYREFFLELFRKEDPELINCTTHSRFNSFFAVESIEDAERYLERFGFKGRAKIYEVFTDLEAELFDMTWLDQKFPKDYKQFGYYYRHYWKGLKIEDDPHLSSHEKRGSLMEALITTNVLVGEVVKIANQTQPCT